MNTLCTSEPCFKQSFNMAFSQSLDIGNSTLLNLDSQARKAIDCELVELQRVPQTNPENNEDAADVIQESPVPVKEMSTYNRSRTQRLWTRNSSSVRNEKQRQKLRKSKSDSTLGKCELPSTGDNYTEMFRSGFTFSVEDGQSKVGDGEASVLRVSQIEAAFLDIPEEEHIDIGNNIDEDNLDIPIFSEDIKGILCQEDQSRKSNGHYGNCNHTTLYTHKTNGIPKPSEGDNELNTEQLDQSRFICADLPNEQAQQQIIKELNASRREVEKDNKHDGKCGSKAMKFTPNKALRSDTFKTAKLLEIDKRTSDLESLKRISAWNLPHSVLQEYEKKGVNKMFDWQIECLSNPKVLFEHCNLVYSAPTSAGKSLVSEILLLKTVLERGKKVLFILPLISVVREKMFYLQDLLTVAGYRVEGFFGGYSPPGGFDNMHVAICTIEKANSIVNKLMEQGKLSDIGTVIVDEVHLISDSGRGYILELLIAKVLYMSRKYGFQLQVVAMSATLANVELLKQWLDAELYITDFRPVALKEMIKIGNTIYDNEMRALRDVTKPLQGERQCFPQLPNDNDHVAQLCIETILEGCSVVVFCPSKDWCENLAIQLAGAIQTLLNGGDEKWVSRLRAQIKSDAIDEVKKQLRDIPTGLDAVLDKTITFGCAFHHAGLTSEERDIIEASFKSCALKIIVATSTLSSGVNLPARRVLIRTPLFGGKQMSSLTYRQMIGRAGRTGKDTLGESVLICTPANARIGQQLVLADLKPIHSCLEQESSTHLKRALLEVISSGVAVTKVDIENFVNCTLLSAEKQLSEQGKDKSAEDEVPYITEALDFLIEYEFVRLQVDSESRRESYVATRLGQACLAASMPPTDGLLLFAELQKSRRCFVLESELHAVYLVTPYSVCYQLQDLDWLLFLDMWEKLTPAMKKVGELVGVKESFLVRAMRGQSKLDYKLMQIHKRFYTALALQELVNEVPINNVAAKYKCTRGMLQGLQQMSSTFAGIVTAFCNSLQWPTLSLIVSQFKERLFFGIHRDLIDLMRLPDLNHKRARALYDAGIETLVELANADVFDVEKILHNALSFDSSKQHDNEADYEAEQRKQAREFFITGKRGLTVAEGAKLLIEEARTYVQYEIGVGAIKWTQTGDANTAGKCLEMSYEDDRMGGTHGNKRKRELKEHSGHKTEITPPKLVRQSESSTEKIDDDDRPSTSKAATRRQKLHALAEQKQQTPPEKCGKQEEQKHESKSGAMMPPPTTVGCATRNRLDKNIEQSCPADSAPQNQRGGPLTANSNAITQARVNEITQTNKRAAGQESNNKENAEKQGTTKNQHEKLEEKVKISSPNLTSKSAENHKLQNCNDLKSKPNALQESTKNPINSKQSAAISLNPNLTSKSAENHKLQNCTDFKSKPNALQESTKNPINSKQSAAIPLPSNKYCVDSQAKANAHAAKSLNAFQLKQVALPKLTANAAKQSPQAQQGLRAAPRRSPRNHQNSNNTCKAKQSPIAPTQTVTKRQHIEESIFMPDDSFELNTGINAALEAGKQTSESTPKQLHNNNKANDDEIPESQEIVQAVADSPVPAKHSVHASRLLRTTQRLRGHKGGGGGSCAREQSDAASLHSPPAATSSIEVSDLSLENSLLKNPLQLNASHILNCSKTETTSVNFQSLNLVDICGDRRLFDGALHELIAAKRFGFCLGLQQLENKRKLLIGGNLLINQRGHGAAAGEDKVAAREFQIDDNHYLAGCAFAISDNIVYYMNMQLEERRTSNVVVTTSMKHQFLRTILTANACTLLCIDAKEQLKILCRMLDDNGLSGELRVELEDPKVANWLLQPDKIMSFTQMTQQFAPECTALTSLCGNGRGYGSHGLDTASAILAKIRCSVEACVTMHILKAQIENLERIGSGQLYKFFKELEMPLQNSLCIMELVGFPVNEAALRGVFQQMLETMKKLETKIYEMNGGRFNLGSSAAVAKVVGLHRKASGRISTTRQILEKIDSPISQAIVAYRKLSTTLTKNIQPLLKCVQKERIHGQSVTFTQTGRISMTEPNLQNVANDFEVNLEGKQSVTISCRSAFFPSDSGRCLLSSDFCQLEMRILAHLSQDAALLKVMNTDRDIFTAIAARWHKVSEASVSQQLRNGTKQICYGIVYGMGMRSLAEALKCAEQEAATLSQQFHLAYPGIRLYADKIVKFARNNGYIETITGRRRYLEQINSEEPQQKKQAERQAINSTIQGSAADIAKNAILRMEKNIEKYRDKLGLADANAVRFVLHIHDELVFEVPADKARKVAKILSLTMENCVKLSVPLKVRLKVGKSWGELTEIKL